MFDPINSKTVKHYHAFEGINLYCKKIWIKDMIQRNCVWNTDRKIYWVYLIFLRVNASAESKSLQERRTSSFSFQVNSVDHDYFVFKARSRIYIKCATTKSYNDQSIKNKFTIERLVTRGKRLWKILSQARKKSQIVFKYCYLRA